MVGFVSRRALRGLLTLWTVATVVFIGSRISGDPTFWLLPDDAPIEQREALRTQLGLDGSLADQYGHYLAQVSRGDFGLSFRERRPVIEMFVERIPATLRLAGIAFLLSLLLGVPIGIVAALNRNTVLDRFVMSLSFFGQALPNFVLGIALILVFSLFLRVLPSGGDETWRHYLMPVITLGTASAAGLARLTRSGMLDVLQQDYMRTAAAKGLTRSVVVLKHGLRNGFLPVLTVLGFQLGTLITGSVVVETVFAWPGMGRLIVTAVTGRDYPVLQFSVLVVAGSVVLANTLVDILYGTLDPRVREA